MDTDRNTGASALGSGCPTLRGGSGLGAARTPTCGLGNSQRETGSRTTPEFFLAASAWAYCTFQGYREAPTRLGGGQISPAWGLTIKPEQVVQSLTTSEGSRHSRDPGKPCTPDFRESPSWGEGALSWTLGEGRSWAGGEGRGSSAPGTPSRGRLGKVQGSEGRQGRCPGTG